MKEHSGNLDWKNPKLQGIQSLVREKNKRAYEFRKKEIIGCLLYYNKPLTHHPKFIS